MEQKKNSDVGAIWIKSGNYGDYLSISVEINGVKHNFAAFPNKYKQDGDNKPAYRIPAPKIEAQPGQDMNKYKSQLDTVAAIKSNVEQIKASHESNANHKTIFESEDLPF